MHWLKISSIQYYLLILTEYTASTNRHPAKSCLFALCSTKPILTLISKTHCHQPLIKLNRTRLISPPVTPPQELISSPPLQLRESLYEFVNPNSLVEIGSSLARNQWSSMVARGALAKALLTGDSDSKLDLLRGLWSGCSIELEMVPDYE